MSKYVIEGPDGAVYGVSDSGWLEKTNFSSWFDKVFIPSDEL